MRSLIILEVEHGEDTDEVQGWVEHIQSEFTNAAMFGGTTVTLTNYSVRVDLPSCFVLD